MTKVERAAVILIVVGVILFVGTILGLAYVEQYPLLRSVGVAGFCMMFLGYWAICEEAEKK